MSELLKRRFNAGRAARVLSPAPGISTERLAAISAGSTQLITGYYTASGDSISVTAFAETPETQKLKGPIHASGSLFTVADAIAKQLNAPAPAPPNPNMAAWKEFALANDSAVSSDAANHYSLALKADPNFGAAYVGAANAAVLAGDVPRAHAILLEASTRTAALDAEDRAYLQLESANLSRDPAARVEALRAVLSVNAGEEQVLRALADSEMAARRPGDAATHYRQLIAMAPSDENLSNLLTYAALYSGDEGAARAAAQEYKRVFPQQPNAFDTAGDVEFGFGHFAEAEKNYLASPNAQFQDFSPTWKAARARLMSGDAAGAGALFEKHRAALAGAQNPGAAFRAAEWLYLTGRHTEAIASMSQFASQSAQPEWRSAGYAQAAVWALLAQNKPSAVKWSDLALRPAQKSTFLTAALARFLAQPPAGPADWRARADSSFNGANTAEIRRQALGYALLLSKNFGEAAEVWKQVYGSTSVNDPAPAYLYAWALLETGHRAEAAPLLRLNPIPSPAIAPSFEAVYVPAVAEWRKNSLRQ